MASKDNRKRKFSTASPIKPLPPSPTKMKICYNAEYFKEVDKVIHGRFLDSQGLVVMDGGHFTLVRYDSEDEANHYYENAYKAQGEHVPGPSGIHMPKKGPLKGGVFLFYKGHHIKPLSRWLKENKVKNMEENGMLQVIRGIFQALRTLYHKHERGHGDLGSGIIEGVAVQEDGNVVLWNLPNKLDEIHVDAKGNNINYSGIICDLDYLRDTIFSRDVKGKLHANDKRSFPIKISPIKNCKRYGKEMQYLYKLLTIGSTGWVKDAFIVEFILCPPLCWTPEDRIYFIRTFSYLSKNYNLKKNNNFNDYIKISKLGNWAIKTRSLIHKADAANQVLAAVFAYSGLPRKNLFSQEVFSYCGSPLIQIPKAYSIEGSIVEFPRNKLEHFRDNFRAFFPNASMADYQFTDHQILGFIESAFPRLWCVLHQGLMRAMCDTERGTETTSASFTAVKCPWSVRDILTHRIFDPKK